MGAVDGLWELFFPPCCMACGGVLERPQPFCAPCQLEVEPVQPGYCPRCAEPDTEGAWCGRCRLFEPPFLAGFAPFVHVGSVARAIHQFKYEDCPHLAAPLARLLLNHAGAFLGSAPGLLCPLPLHPHRFYRRRYDQAMLLAHQLGQLSHRPVCAQALRRVTPTQRQVGLSEEQREENVRAAFEASPEVQGHALVLIDDVLTTGATARAATRALLSAGAREVRVLTIARANLWTG